MFTYQVVDSHSTYKNVYFTEDIDIGGEQEEQEVYVTVWVTMII
jgi:hypothetical protein